MSEDRLAEPGEDPILPEETPEVTPEPEAKAPDPVPEKTEVVAKEEEEPQPVPTVPLAALNEARHTIRELKQTQAQRDQQFQELKAQMDEWRKSQQQVVEKKQFETDPLGAIQNDLKALKEQQENAVRNSAQREQQLSLQQQLERTVVAQVQEFRQTAPDYDNALKHLLEARARELRRFGTPEDQVNSLLEQESIGLAQTALSRGENPAALVYDLAKERGYRPAKAEKTADDKIASIEKGQKASTTLTDARGDAGKISLTDIANMSDEDFDKNWDVLIGKKNK